MRGRTWPAGVAAVLAATVFWAPGAIGAPPPGPPEELRFTFIGNVAFHVTDGRSVLLTDFPYESGAFGYMRWEPRDVPPVKDGLALIYHHQDGESVPGDAGERTVPRPGEVLSLRGR